MQNNNHHEIDIASPKTVSATASLATSVADSAVGQSSTGAENVASAARQEDPGPSQNTVDKPPRLKSRTTSHTLLSSAIDENSTSSAHRKSGYAEAGTTDTNSERASISMPPPPSRPSVRSRASSSFAWNSKTDKPAIMSSSAQAPFDHEEVIEDAETPRLATGLGTDAGRKSPLVDATSAYRSRQSSIDTERKRMSVSSIYSLTSARAGGGGGGSGGGGGAPSSSASANGSDNGSRAANPHSAGLGISCPETTTSAVSVTTSTAGSSGGHTPSGSGQLTTRDLPAPVEAASKRNPVRADPSSRAGPTRSRSRAKRRFSGSTGASSHSPSSERGAFMSREKEETKPAPLGIIGVCALDVKARSKPSRNILNRLIANGEFQVVVFGDKVILDEDIENWPICDFLISFYSEGFPLDKAIAYAKARKPFCVNDLPMQQILWDRRICMRILDKIKVPTPRRLEVNRDGGPSIKSLELARYLKDVTGVVLDGPEDGTGGKVPLPRKVELLHDGDTLSVDGAFLQKPFVEKPVSGEDHNICIYYPKSQGGGARKLFRKIGNKSSEWVEGMVVPRVMTEEGSSYVYEQFMDVDNSEDVKAYTVGASFCHAETRKSPVVDGLVRRNTHGKEIRYITSLTKDEAAMAGRIATYFGQRVCGFDLLRAGGKSYVIDVNGWSFVKDNDEYYDQCANILKDMFVREKQRKEGSYISSGSLSYPIVSDNELSPPSKKDPHHREGGHLSALQQILGNSPSMSKLSGHSGGRKTSKGPSSPDSATFPMTSPPSFEDLTPRLPELGGYANDPLLPPPAVSTNSSTCPTLPASPSQVGPGAAETMAPPAPKHTWKLKGMVSVIRHADRTPKQKYKFTFHTKPFIELLKGHQEEVLLTGEAALDSVIIAVDQAMREGEEDRVKLRTLRNVLVKKGGWAGTKVQIKPMFRKRKPAEIPLSEEVAVPESSTEANAIALDKTRDIGTTDEDGEDTARRSPTRQDSISDTTLSRITAAEESLVLDKLQLIVKWGGEPTHSARYQTTELGVNMRKDLLLMNRDILDEVHVFSSSERRVTTSAQIWASSFLDLKDLPSDYITIRKDLLDDSNAAKDVMDKVKKKLKNLLREGSEAPPQFAWPPNMPEPSVVGKQVVGLMHFHRRVMRHNFAKLFNGASSSLSAAISNPGGKSTPNMSQGQGQGQGQHNSSPHALSQVAAMNSIQARWCCGEDADLFKERWEKLFAEFCDGDKVDPSKISELYDTMKFDALHNKQFLEWIFTPSKSMLEEEEAATATYNPKNNQKEAEESAKVDDAKSDKNQTLPTAQEESNKTTNHRRSVFRRRSMVATPEDAPEQYFHLFTGNSQTKAKADARLEKLRELYKLAKVLFDFIGPQEYGMTDNEKLEIGLLTSLPLLREVVQDLEEMQASDDAKAFIYFTKESHVYTLLNCILEGGIESKIKRSAIPELDYLSQICFELYESENKTPDDAPADAGATFDYSIRISISPGCHTFDPLDVQLDSKHCIGCATRRSLTAHNDWMKVIETLRAKFHQVKLPKSFLAVNLSESHTFHKKEDLSPEKASVDVDADKVSMADMLGGEEKASKEKKTDEEKKTDDEHYQVVEHALQDNRPDERDFATRR